MIKNLGFILSIMRSYGNVTEGWYDRSSIFFPEVSVLVLTFRYTIYFDLTFRHRYKFFYFPKYQSIVPASLILS